MPDGQISNTRKSSYLGLYASKTIGSLRPSHDFYTIRQIIKLSRGLLWAVEKLCQFWYRVVDMKTSIHPDNYRLVVFDDEAAGFSFLTRSTAPTNETIKWEDGNEYPVVKIHISSASHPFFTGEEKIIDTEGRVDRFAAKMKAAAAHREELAKKAAAAKAKAEQLAAEAKQAVEDAEAKDA